MPSRQPGNASPEVDLRRIGQPGTRGDEDRRGAQCDHGAAGLHATLTTLEAGTTLALANKESLVIGGTLVTQAARPGQLVAVDSEHSAFAQCLRGGGSREVRSLMLTASGGPFRGRTRDELRSVTPSRPWPIPPGTWAG